MTPEKRAAREKYEAMLDKGLEHKAEALQYGMPWLCSCQCCDKLRISDAMAILGRKAKGRKRPDQPAFAGRVMLRHARRHAREAEEKGKPWTCCCRSCHYSRTGIDLGTDNRLQGFTDLRKKSRT